MFKPKGRRFEPRRNRVVHLCLALEEMVFLGIAGSSIVWRNIYNVNKQYFEHTNGDTVTVGG